MINKVEPTEKQKRAAENIIRQKASGKNVNKGEALRDAGYSDKVAKNPKAVTKSAGFLTYMSDNGVTEQGLAGMLAADLDAKPGDRLGELKFAASLMGIEGAQDTGNAVQVNVMLDKMRDFIDGEAINEED